MVTIFKEGLEGNVLQHQFQNTMSQCHTDQDISFHFYTIVAIFKGGLKRKRNVLQHQFQNNKSQCHKDEDIHHFIFTPW